MCSTIFPICLWRSWDYFSQYQRSTLNRATEFTDALDRSATRPKTVRWSSQMFTCKHQQRFILKKVRFDPVLLLREDSKDSFVHVFVIRQDDTKHSLSHEYRRSPKSRWNVEKNVIGMRALVVLFAFLVKKLWLYPGIALIYWPWKFYKQAQDRSNKPFTQKIKHQQLSKVSQSSSIHGLMKMGWLYLWSTFLEFSLFCSNNLHYKPQP